MVGCRLLSYDRRTLLSGPSMVGVRRSIRCLLKLVLTRIIQSNDFWPSDLLLDAAYSRRRRGREGRRGDGRATVVESSQRALNEALYSWSRG